MEPADAQRWTGPLVVRARPRSQWHVVLLGLAFLSPVALVGAGTDVVGWVALALMVPVGLLVLATVAVPRLRAEVVIDGTHLTVRAAGRVRALPLVALARVAVQQVGHQAVVRVETDERQRLPRRRRWWTEDGALSVPDAFPMRPEAIAEEIRARAALARAAAGLPARDLG